MDPIGLVDVEYPAGMGNDWSGSAAAVGTVLATIPANYCRRGFYIQNQSANQIQVVLDDGASGTPTIVLIAAGGGVNQQGGDWSFTQAGIRHVGRIRICGTVGTQFGAREY